MNITKENIEEQILMLVDGELDTASEKMLMAYIEAHPEYRSLLDAYKAVQLQPEPEIRFPGLESLLQPEAPAVLPFPKKKPVIAWAAAAAVVLCLGIGATLIYKGQQADKAPALAVKPAAQQQNTLRPAPQPAPAVIATTATPVTHHITSHSEKAIAAPATQQDVVLPVPAAERKKELIASLSTANNASVAPDAGPVPIIAANAPQMPVLPAEDEESSSWSPVNKEKMQGVNELVAQVQTLKENIQEKARSLKGTTIVLRWGNKELALGK